LKRENRPIEASGIFRSEDTSIEISGMQRTPKLRVLHVLDNLGMGGAETWLMELLRFWSREGKTRPQLDFVATGGKPSYYDEEARALGANIYYLRYDRSHLLSFANGFRDILRRANYAAIHDHGDYSSGWHFLIAGSALPAVRVTHVHNPAFQIRDNYGVTPSRRITAQIGKALVARYGTHIVGTSEQAIAEYGFTARQFKHVHKLALHCGFDPAPVNDVVNVKETVCREFGWPKGAKIILFAGRIDQSPDLGHSLNHKNSGFAVSVGIEAARIDSRTFMVLAGAPSAAVPILQERIARAGFAGRIQFVGIRRDLKRLMYASDALLFPSRGEGLGMVAVEAQAAGLPVLASTSVPRECVVVPQLVVFKELEAGAAQWSADLLQLATQPTRVAQANQQVAASHFAINYSAGALLKLYSQGLLS
jgi:glycosyltransferase EpsF